ncbi:MAG: hypothetical protein U5L96_19360 [Owenweeksia sp.]|nr:hypothetical protein [Owenweeksia sp.]
MDDGTRALPERAALGNIPTPISGASSDEVNDFVQSFDRQLGASRATSPINYSASLSLGNQWLLNENKNNKLGYIFSLSYKRSFKYYDDVTYGEYQRYKNPTINDMRYATIQNGELGEDMALIGAPGVLAYKTSNSKYRLTAMRLQKWYKQGRQI